jgi:hypothetical protein
MFLCCHINEVSTKVEQIMACRFLTVSEVPENIDLVSLSAYLTKKKKKKKKKHSRRRRQNQSERPYGASFARQHQKAQKVQNY